MRKQSSSERPHSTLHFAPPSSIGEVQQPQRRRIIEAMVASCAEKTYPATTIGDIVSRAGISRTTFYKSFADKRQCFDATLDACIAELGSVAGASVRGADTPPEAVRKTAAAMLELMASRPALAQLLAAEAVAVEPAVTGRYRRLVVPALEDLWCDGPPPGSHTSPGLAFGRAQVLVFSEVAAGRSERLAELQPEIVYLAVAPFAGHDEAVHQARLAAAEHPYPVLDGIA
jgi:AcrR family transcriptional regulator